MLVSTEAIVLNRIKYTDNSYVVNLYSEAIGKITVLARVSSRKPDIKANAFSPLNIIRTEFKLKGSRSVHSINYVELVKCLPNNDITKICISQFIAEVISKTIKEEEKNTELYNFFISTIHAIENSDKNTVNIHLIFLKELARLMGFQITNNFCEETPYFNTREGMFLPVYTTDEESFEIPLSTAFSQLLNSSYSNNSYKFPHLYRQKMIESLLSYYKIHTEHLFEIKSLKVLNDVFNEE